MRQPIEKDEVDNYKIGKVDTSVPVPANAPSYMYNITPNMGCYRAEQKMEDWLYL